MKSIVPVVAILFVAASFVAAQDEPPTLGIVEAAQSAQRKLQEENLPKEFYIRSISLVTHSVEPQMKQYEARFEPTLTRRVKIGSEPEPVKYKVIVVSMDGSANIEERERVARRVIRRGEVPSQNGKE